MSARVLLIYQTLWKSDKMQGLSIILSLLCDEFDQFNNTGVWMLDSIYHRT